MILLKFTKNHHIYHFLANLPIYIEICADIWPQILKMICRLLIVTGVLENYCFIEFTVFGSKL
jgi:hypothetical protein